MARSSTSRRSSAFVPVVILALIKWGKAAYVDTSAVLLGIIAGAVLAAILGKDAFSDKAGYSAAWFDIVSCRCISACRQFHLVLYRDDVQSSWRW